MYNKDSGKDIIFFRGRSSTYQKISLFQGFRKIAKSDS